MTAEQRGYFDAERGITTSPYGLPACAEAWANGHDAAFDAGLTSLPRFGRLTQGRKRR